MITGCDSPRLAIAWTTQEDEGVVAIVELGAKGTAPGATFSVGPDVTLATFGETVFALSRRTGGITAIDTRTNTARPIVELGESSQVMDLVAISESTAYVSRGTATQLLRLDLASGAAEDVVDLSVFADEDGIPEMSRMIAHEGRLYIQIQRFNADAPNGFALPAMIAVVDLASETLVDVDAALPGLQAIELEGTAPKQRMQIVGDRLFTSSTGGFFDDGGIEIIDLSTLQSLGLAIREEDGEVGADLGSVVLADSENGYLTYSTDLTLSSHLFPFSVSGGVGPLPGMHTSVDYFVPAMVIDAGRLYVPDGAHEPPGILVFDTASNALRPELFIATAGAPTDVVLVKRMAGAK